MKIGEIARAAEVSTSRIRFYEKRGLSPRRRATTTAIATTRPISSVCFATSARRKASASR
jgi:hypothetical protein